MLKKLLTFVLILVGAFTLVGCGNNEPTKAEILEQITEAVDNLSIPSSTETDLTLPTTEVHDVTITWESSDTDYIADDGTVTIPLYTEGDQTVTLTAYVELEGETLTKTFTVTVPAATEMTDVDRVLQAKDALLLPVSGILTSSFTPPATGANGTTITWSSSDTDVLDVDGTVVRPVNGEGNASVTLTATITLNDESVTKDFDLIVAEEAAVVAYTVVANIVQETLGTAVSFQGTVSGLFDGGYFLTDGTNAFGVYNPSSSLDLEIGDEVLVKGSFAKYNTLYQISSVESEEIVTEGDGTNDLAAITKTVGEVLALDSSDALVHGMIYTVTGTLVEDKNADGYDSLFIKDGDDMLLFYYSSLEASLDELYDMVGTKVTVDIIYYTDHSRNGVLVAFDGGASDIALAPLTDAEAVVADGAVVVDAPKVTTGDITLPTTGANGTTYGTWTSSNSDLLSDAGVLDLTEYAALTENTEVTFTASVTKGTESDTASFTVVVAPPISVSDVNDLEVGDYFNLVDAVVYEESYYGFYVWDGTEYLFVYEDGIFDDIKAGDKIDIVGYLGEYGGLRQANIMDHTVTVATEAVPTPVETTVEAVLNNHELKGVIARVTAEVTIEGDYDDVMLNGATGAQLKVYYRSNADELEDYEGQVITVDVISYQDGQVLYNLVKADATVVNADATAYTWTDAQLAQALADSFSFDEMVEMDLDLITSDDDATYAWASDNEAVIATDGTVTAVAGSETPVTLTVTATVGTETGTQSFDVVVADANDIEVPMTVAEALAEDLDADLFVIGVVSGFSAYDEPIIQDPDGTAITTFYPEFDDNDVQIGDKITVRGVLGVENKSSTSYEDVIRFEDAELVEIISSGNPVFVDTTVSASVLADNAEDYQAERFVMNLKIKSFDDGFGMIKFYGGTDMDIILDQYDAPFINDDLFDIDDIVNIEFNVDKWNHYGNVRISTPEFTLSNSQKMAVAEFNLNDMMPSLTVNDLNLEDTSEFGVNLNWSSSNTAVIANDGTVTPGTTTETVTLTVELSVGTLSKTLTFDISVPNAYVPGTPDIFISEYIEGSSNNKAIEIYNPTDATIDLTGYEIILFSNGSDYDDPGNRLDLSGYTIASGETLVFYNSSADTAISSVGDASSTITYFNGDDALVLFRYGEVLDVFGVVGEDPGSNWAVGTDSTGEHTLVRNATVTVPNQTWDPTEWTAYDADTFDYLGSHTSDAPAS